MNIYITLDYELFSGEKTGTIENCIIHPMEKLKLLFDKYQIKATFFVDASYLYSLDKNRDKNIQLRKDWDSITANIKDLCDAGHDIELHIHPQWYYTSFQDGRWELDQEHFKISDMPSEDVSLYVSGSQNLLEKISGRKTSVFRAGGYSIQSLDDYPQFFKDHHICADSSVLSGCKYESENQWYDYTTMPSKLPYKFSTDIIVEDKNGFMTEFPITTLEIGKCRYLRHRLYSRFIIKAAGKRYGDGTAIYPKQQTVVDRLIKFIKSPYIVQASFDGTNGAFLKVIYNKCKKQNKDLVIISHPKLLTPFSLKSLEDFIQMTNMEANFCTIHEYISTHK